MKFTFYFSILFAAYHYVTAGIGVPIDYWHMGSHMAGVMILVFIGFPAFRGRHNNKMRPNRWWIYGNVPIWDWLFIVAGVASAYYVGITWYEIDFESACNSGCQFFQTVSCAVVCAQPIPARCIKSVWKDKTRLHCIPEVHGVAPSITAQNPRALYQCTTSKHGVT